MIPRLFGKVLAFCLRESGTRSRFAPDRALRVMRVFSERPLIRTCPTVAVSKGVAAGISLV